MVFPSAYEVEIQRFANALYNLQVGSTTMNQVQSDIATLGSVDATLNYYFNYINGAQSNAQVAETLLANFGLVAGQNGLDATEVGYARDYIVGALAAVPANQRGAAVVDIAAAFASLSSDGTYGAAATAWNAEITAAIAYDDAADAPAGSVVDFFRLSAERDILSGTAGDDVFSADVIQVGGAQVNALGTGDNLTGGAGHDTLDAQVTQGVYAGNVYGDGNMPIMPQTVGIEDVQLEAIFHSLGYSDSDDVYFSAKNMRGIDFIGSDHSDADLVIQDLTVDANELTSSMTIGMAYTGNSDHNWDESDLAVYFDEDDLLAGTDANPGAVYYWILDEIAWDVVSGVYVPPADSPYRDPSAPVLPVGNLADGVQGDEDLLWRIDRNGVSFNLEGVPYEVIIGNLVPTQDYRAANDHLTYVQYLNTELNAMKAADSVLNGLSFSLDTTLTRNTQTDFAQTAIVPAIVLSDENARLLTDPAISRDRGATGYFDVFGDISDLPPTPVDLLISVDVELEKVGRGADGGDLIIGGMYKGADNIWGEGSSLKPAGVQQFDVTVLGNALLPNSLASLESTNNALQIVNISSEAGVVLGDAAALIIGNSNTDGFGTAEGLGTLLGNAQALKDVQILNAADFLGDLTVYAALTDEIGPKYLDLVDLQNVPADDNDEFVYTLGQADDYLNLVISDANLLAIGTTTREDFELTINGGTGDDTIETLIGSAELYAPANDITPWYFNSHLNNTNPFGVDGDPKGYLEINAEAGNDTVWTKGAGDFVINAGSGNDVVFIDNFSTGTKAQWALNFLVFPTLSDVNNNNNPVLADGTDLNITYDLTATVTFNDLVATATISFSGVGTAAPTVSDLVLNQLVKQAINDDFILSELLLASDGPANTLLIDALINGDQSVDSGILQPAHAPSATQTAGELTIAFTTEGPAAWAPSFYPLQQTIAGTNDAASTDNVINLGSGNDLLVLTSANNAVVGTFTVTVAGTDTTPVTATATGLFESGALTDCNDTIVYDAVNFGNDTILNFIANSGAASGTVLPTAVLGEDKFDFTVLKGDINAALTNFGQGVINLENLSISIVEHSLANDTNLEIAQAYDNGTASSHIFIRYDSATTNDNNIASVFTVVDSTAAGTADPVVTLIGTIDLADTDWSSLGISNFA